MGKQKQTNTPKSSCQVSPDTPCHDASSDGNSPYSLYTYFILPILQLIDNACDKLMVHSSALADQNDQTSVPENVLEILQVVKDETTEAFNQINESFSRSASAKQNKIEELKYKLTESLELQKQYHKSTQLLMDLFDNISDKLPRSKLNKIDLYKLINSKSYMKELLDTTVTEINLLKNRCRRQAAESLGVVSKQESVSKPVRRKSECAPDEDNSGEGYEPVALDNASEFTFTDGGLKNIYDRFCEQAQNGLSQLEMLEYFENEMQFNMSYCQGELDIGRGDVKDDCVVRLATDDEFRQMARTIIMEIYTANTIIVPANTGKTMNIDGDEAVKLTSKGIHKRRVLNYSTLVNGQKVITCDYRYFNPADPDESEAKGSVIFNSLCLSGSKAVYMLHEDLREFETLRDYSPEGIIGIVEGITSKNGANKKVHSDLLEIRERILERDSLISIYEEKLVKCIKNKDLAGVKDCQSKLLEKRFAEILKHGHMVSLFVAEEEPLGYFNLPSRSNMHFNGSVSPDIAPGSVLNAIIPIWHKSEATIGLIASLLSTFIGLNTSKNAVHRLNMENHGCILSQPHTVNMINIASCYLSLAAQDSLNVIRASSGIMCDEVTVKRLVKDEGVQVKYMYSLENGRSAPERHVYISYTGSREYKHLLRILHVDEPGFKAGFLHTDGYIVYRKFISSIGLKRGMVHALCLVHARRGVMKYMIDSGLMEFYVEKVWNRESSVKDILDRINDVRKQGEHSEVDCLLMEFILMLSLLFTRERDAVNSYAGIGNRFADTEFMEALGNDRKNVSSILFFLADQVMVKLSEIMGLEKSQDGRRYKSVDAAAHPAAKGVALWMNNRNNIKSFLENPEIELSTNVIERNHRSTAVSFHHFKYLRSDAGCIGFGNLITVQQNCRLAGIDFGTYIKAFFLMFNIRRNQLLLNDNLIEQINADYMRITGCTDFDIRPYIHAMPKQITLKAIDPETGALVAKTFDLSDPLNPALFYLRYISPDGMSPQKMLEKGAYGIRFRREIKGSTCSHDAELPGTDTPSSGTVNQSKYDKELACVDGQTGSVANTAQEDNLALDDNGQGENESASRVPWHEVCENKGCNAEQYEDAPNSGISGTVTTSECNSSPCNLPELDPG